MPQQNRLSRELSYLLRHGAQRVGLPIRSDGYLRHRSLLGRMDFATLQNIVRDDPKSRYGLLQEGHNSETSGSWWIRANQGHSMPNVILDLKPIQSASEIPIAVHGTSMSAWKVISEKGLSRMTRNHIHLAQGFVGDVISGMRSSSEILIFIDVASALDTGIKFYVSSNGVILTPGDNKGYLECKFFSRVERVKPSSDPIPGWDTRDKEIESGDVKP
ncbi:phosphotransferase KptA/Tpt1 [Mycena pura]|uniref:2'-phosphotransferase n=1 Tax=Mycena pura TaxID=153505 RepID=A0AAD6YVC6_9AGAR|nr:phosphotransferase KptA/Tpt1 [Mycena pura]